MTARENAGVTDGQLVRRAQGGDPVSLGMLLERHRARLYARATAMLGAGHADDAVQDAFLVALRRIGDVRDPDAVGAWLLAVVSNACRARLRRPSHETLTADPPDRALETAAKEIERAAQRDWIWTALERLSEPLRLVIMLRHFSDVSSYEEIAALCDVPVGTIRSRLNAARAQLAAGLLATVEEPHLDTAKLAQERGMTLGGAFADFGRGGGASALARAFEPEVAFALFDRRLRTGVDELARALESDRTDGVTWEVRRAVPGLTFTVVELVLHSPPDWPDHCPPLTTQVHFHPDGRTERLACHYSWG